MRTFDRGVDIATAPDYLLERELAMTLEYIADNRRAYPSGNDPRFETVREIIREQERRKFAPYQDANGRLIPQIEWDEKVRRDRDGWPQV